VAIPATPFEADFGGGQGRIEPSATAPAGSYVYQLGHETAGVLRQFADGDYHQILQNATLTAGTKVLRARATVRPPATMPDGCSWTLELLVDGDAAATIDITSGAARILGDLAADVVNLAVGAHDFAFRLTFSAPAGTYTVELPGCAIDDVVEDATAQRPGVINRSPEPGEVEAPLAGPIVFDLIETGASTPDISRTTVYVNDAAVFVAGTFSAGWTADSTYGGVSGLGTDVVRISLVPDLPLASQTVYTVRVVSAVSSGLANALDTSWSFTTLDARAPTVLSAAAIDQWHVQVTFSEPVVQSSATGATDALNPGQYTFTLVEGAPAVTPDAPTTASVLGSVIEPFSITPGGTVAASVGGGEAATALFEATQASVESASQAHFTLGDGKTLTGIVDGGAEWTKTFATAEFADITQATPADVAASLNTFFASEGIDAFATATVDDTVSIASDRAGTASSIEITGGDSNPELAFSTTVVYGTGNVANAAQVTAGEAAQVIGDAISGVLVSDVSGAVQVETVAGGPSASLLLSGTELAALGLDTALHLGTSGVVSVASGLTSDVVVIEVADPLTNGATYQVAALGVADLSGNVIEAPNNAAIFIPDTCPAVPGRSYSLLSRLPQINRDVDETGDLRKFIACFQVVFDELLCDIDRWTDILDVDLAPEAFVDAMLADLGNPFGSVVVTLTQKRKLVRLLVPLYRQKGTDVGMVNAIRLLTGAEVTITAVGFDGIWKLGISLLGIDTVVGTDDLEQLYSFDVVSPETLTETQRARIRTAVAFMRRAPCHLRSIVEPTAPSPTPDHWELGLSLLGTETILH